MMNRMIILLVIVAVFLGGCKADTTSKNTENTEVSGTEAEKSMPAEEPSSEEYASEATEKIPVQSEVSEEIPDTEVMTGTDDKVNEIESVKKIIDAKNEIDNKDETVSDHPRYNDESEISVEGDSWGEAYIDLIDEYMRYECEANDISEEDRESSFLFSLLYLNDDDIPEILIDIYPYEGSLPFEEMYSFDGNKTFCLKLPLLDALWDEDEEICKGLIIYNHHFQDMSHSNSYYELYVVNEDLSYETECALREEYDFSEEKGHYYIQRGKNNEEEVSEKDYDACLRSYQKKKGIDFNDPEKSTAPRPEYILKNVKFNEIADYLRTKAG